MTALVADICKRWNIDPAYDGSINATFTEHRMFAATGCPGDYMHARMRQIIAEVKAAMNDSTGEWVKDERGWWYRYPNGTWPAAKWELINGKWYYFGEDGYMDTGWLEYKGDWYYLDATNGDMATGFKRIVWKGKARTFHFADTGAMSRDRFELIGGKWYAFDSNGVLVADGGSIPVDSRTGAITIKAAS
jgi:hypothetical protein